MSSSTITMIATISVRSELANLVTIPPILFAIPVSKSAPPTMNIATNKMTLLSMNPANEFFNNYPLVSPVCGDHVRARKDSARSNIDDVTVDESGKCCFHI